MPSHPSRKHVSSLGFQDTSSMALSVTFNVSFYDKKHANNHIWAERRRLGAPGLLQISKRIGKYYGT